MEFWRSKSWLSVYCLYMLSFSFCWSLNDEGVALLRFKERQVSDPHGALSNWKDEIGVESPCSWFGVECADGHVVALNLNDLCLSGTLPPDIGDLVHMKSMAMRNNSLSGAIPEEISNLKELEILDLGNNNFSGQLPSQLENSLWMGILLLDNNELLGSTNPEVHELQRQSEVQVEEDLLSRASRAPSCIELVNSRNSEDMKGEVYRKLSQGPSSARRPALALKFFIPPEPTGTNLPAPAPAPSSIPPTPAPARNPSSGPSAAKSPPPFPVAYISPPFLPNPEEWPPTPTGSNRMNHHRLILSVVVGAALLLLLIIGIIFWKSGKAATVKPWRTGLSGQLQNAFVTGVPELKRSELEVACEDFSNVIGTAPSSSLYKGTLSSGTEIAVASIAAAFSKKWSNSLEAEFGKKIETLSKVNHKNFVNLIGYCAEDEPFTRMMVFEYAPNGTLFERLHTSEAEHLDWEMRLRVAMGIVYCLEHVHQLTPALAHANFNSSAVYLTVDYAAKVSDFGFLGEVSAAETEPDVRSNVHSFGVLLLETITGRLPYLPGSDSLQDWISDYLSGAQPLDEMVDPTLETYSEDQLKQIDAVIRLCCCPDPSERPTMTEVCASLRKITGVGPDVAIPSLSPLWWAELEIMSPEV